MNYIVLIPFKVPNDSLVEFDSKFNSKICKTYDELYDRVMNIYNDNKDEEIILTYVPIDDFLIKKLLKGGYHKDAKLIVQNVNYSILTFAGNTIRIVTINDLSSVPALLSDIIANAKTDNEKYNYRTDTVFSNHPLFNSELCTQLMKTARNYLISKIDIPLEEEVDNLKTTCLDLIKYIVKEKYAFLEDIRMVTQEIDEKTPYEAFSKFIQINRNFELKKFYKFKGKNLVLINYILDHIKIYEKDIDPEKDLLLKDAEFMNDTWFHTTSGWVINISSSGNISMRKEYIIYTEEDMSSSLFDFN